MLVNLPRVSFHGFELVDIALPPPPDAPAPHDTIAHAVDAAFIRGAVGMARLEAERRRQAARRLLIERTKWGAGVVLAAVLGWLLRGLPW